MKQLIVIVFVLMGVYAYADSLTLSFYPAYINEGVEGWTSNANREFKKGATLIGLKYNGTGIDPSGNLTLGKHSPMAVLSATELIDKLKKTVEKARAVKRNPSLKVSRLCIFTHGVVNNRESYLNFGNGNKIVTPIKESYDFTENGLEYFAAEIENYLADDAVVVLYACLLGSTYPDNHINRKPRTTKYLADHRTGGKGSFADRLAEALNETGKSRAVWAHRNTGHTYGNCRWRIFDNHTYDGRKSLILFGHRGNIAGDQASKLMATKLILELNSRGESLSNDDKIAIRKWLGFVIPFLPDQYLPIVQSRRSASDMTFTPGLMDWLAVEYIRTIQDLRGEVFPADKILE